MLPSVCPKATVPCFLGCHLKRATSDDKFCESLTMSGHLVSVQCQSIKGPFPLTNARHVSSLKLHPMHIGASLIIPPDSDATIRCCETLHTKIFKSAPELERMSGSCGCQQMEVIVFLCSDIIECSRNSLKQGSSQRNIQEKKVFFILSFIFSPQNIPFLTLK